MKILITDGNFKHTLAAIRSLKKRGDIVTTCSHIPFSLSFYSKYCDHHFIAPNPETDSEFANFILEHIKQNHYDVIIPVSFASVMQLAPIRKKIEKYNVALPLPSLWSLSIAGNRENTSNFAKGLGIRIPKTQFIDNLDLSCITYPSVIKGPEGSKFMRYINSQNDLIKEIALAPKGSILQEYIKGQGYGFFALYNKGNIQTFFMHKRLREYPVTGGPSTYAISIYDEKLYQSGNDILKHLHWNGVAMVEFKKDIATGEFVLMEINPKLWGSLALSISAGIDFPYLLSRMAVDIDCIEFQSPQPAYRCGIKYRWIFPGDLFNAITSHSFKQFINDFKDPYLKTDINIHDPIPLFTQVGMTIIELVIRLKNNKFWRPHGEPSH